jgi:hypothetical protein
VGGMQLNMNGKEGNDHSLVRDPEVRVRFLALADFLRSSGSGTGCNQPREYNCGAN